ncbi:MAG TPA: histidine--tRNA ligase [Dehalococcoidia bacterium]|nr:histidine--tRNA ligase [Dehalococcoidia bacterium]
MSEPRKLSAPRGTHDVLPDDQPYWSYVLDAATRVAQRYGYQRIDTPVFEDAGVWLRTTGDSTDIVRKEMYVFQDRGGDELALRAEGTASVCRAYIEHGMANLPQPVKLFYTSPIFRYDRPQAGRYRQHTQFGVEAIGDDDPLLDVEVIDLLRAFYDEVGISDYTLQINTIGDPICRPAYLDALRAYYADKLDQVDEDCRERYEVNPMRLLDCKNDRCQPIIAGAPVMTDHLCDACRDHFAQVRRYLAELRVDFQLSPRLVRGLDYYTRTVFEYQPRVEGAQSTLGGGGRYDGLIELLGGKHTPGVGFGCGIERTIINIKRQEVPVPDSPKPLLYVAHLGDGAIATALSLARAARNAGISAVIATGDRSLKAQMRHANTSGARYVAIVGERELNEGTVNLRDLSNGSQEAVLRDDVLSRLAEVS